MLRTIDGLVDILPRPETPLEVPTDSDWDRCRSELTVLPSDYRELLSLYGTGVIDDFLWIYNPAAANEHVNLVSKARIVVAALGESASRFPSKFTMKMFPETGGYLPFAGTDNGDSIFWVTHGSDPNRWPIAVMGPRSPEVVQFDLSLVPFLVRLLRRELHCSIFPADFPSEQPLSFTATFG